MEITYQPIEQQDVEKIFNSLKELILRYEDLGQIDCEKVLAWSRRKIGQQLATTGKFSATAAMRAMSPPTTRGGQAGDRRPVSGPGLSGKGYRYSGVAPDCLAGHAGEQDPLPLRLYPQRGRGAPLPPAGLCGGAGDSKLPLHHGVPRLAARREKKKRLPLLGRRFVSALQDAVFVHVLLHQGEHRSVLRLLFEVFVEVRPR